MTTSPEPKEAASGGERLGSRLGQQRRPSVPPEAVLADPVALRRWKRVTIKLESRRRVKAASKQAVFAMYGGCCSCCGDDHIEFMTIDHIDGNGKVERAVVNPKGVAGEFYRRLAQEPARDDLRILCYNCHMAKDFYGRCPHEQE